MKNFFKMFVLTVLFSTPALAQNEATAFAKRLTDEIMADVVQAKVPLSVKQQAFRRIFIGAINVKTSAKFTLGRYGKTATEDQLNRYADALTDNIVYTWAARFNEYAGETIVFQSERKNEKNDYYVNSSIHLPNAQNDIEIIWRVSNKKGKLKLADLIVEGVSMLMSYRNEYSAVLQQNGGDLDALINLLVKKNETLKNPKKK